MQKKNLKGLTLSELQDFVESLGEKKYRAKQIFAWLYGKCAQSFDEMTDISKEFRDVLGQVAVVENIDLADKEISRKDGTSKFLFRLSDGLKIESVLIPPEGNSPAREKRLTLCISTQVGCPLDCKFCATGTMGLLRNLTVGEILDQLIQVQKTSPRRITNIVFMGMGEPMLNYENVMSAVEIINSDDSFNIGARHITISTAGYADKIRQLADERRTVKLALSLHSLDNEIRSRLMPINKKYDVDDLLDALEYYYSKTRMRPTFEYILFDGVNDSRSDIQRFVKVSKRFPCKVNVIPFHSIEFVHPTGFGATLRATPREKMNRFVQALREAHITVMIRSSAGDDINAACGQLAVAQQAPRRKNAIIPKTASQAYSI
jgi:23S rRNA (adenine2503-C2)-methyltransferase